MSLVLSVEISVVNISVPLPYLAPSGFDAVSHNQCCEHLSEFVAVSHISVVNNSVPYLAPSEFDTASHNQRCEQFSAIPCSK